MKASDLTSFLKFSVKNNFNTLVVGKPGIGKTDIVKQVALQENVRLIISHPVVSDPTDYKGLPFAGSDNIAHFMPFGDLNELITAKEKTIFFLDDLGQAPPSVQAACMQLLWGGQINGHRVSEHVSFIAATNRKQDKAGVSGILEPVKSRFASIVELEVNTDDWIRDYAIPNNMPVELMAFIRFRPELLEKFEPSKDMSNSPCPRTVANVGKMQNAGLDKKIEREAIRGAAGEAFAAEYTGFMQIFRELPSIDEIILNPKKAKVSEEPAVLCGIAAMLAHRMSEQTIEAMITYMDRLPDEINVCTMKDAITRKKDLAHTKAYINWSVKHADLLL